MEKRRQLWVRHRVLILTVKCIALSIELCLAAHGRKRGSVILNQWFLSAFLEQTVLASPGSMFEMWILESHSYTYLIKISEIGIEQYLFQKFLQVRFENHWFESPEPLIWTTIWEKSNLNVMWQPGWEGSLGENGYVCMAESLCCAPETITTLSIGYTPI